MKATCERDKLLHAFQMAASVAPARSPKPILQNVKLELTAEGAILMGTDLEVGIRVDVPGFNVEAPGKVVLPRDRFGKILTESSDEQLAMESDGRKVLVRGQRSEFQLPSENPDEFPDVIAFGEQKYHEMPARFFREVVRRTVYATDNESSRYALGGVLVELTEKGLTAVATDGRRLARQEGAAKSVGGHTNGDNTTIIPTRAMQLIERALGDNDENIRLTARENDVLVQSGRSTIYSRLVEGRFPKWRDVFPRREGMAKIDLTVGPFYAAVRQAAIVTSDERRGVDFNFGGGKIVLAGHGAELGEAHVELPIAYDGPDISITLDPRYLNDFLKVLSPDQNFAMELRDAESAALCSTEDGYAYVLMPLARDR
ncbi:MAG: DNA polymerase III subunit beta [Planctomycetaceae bacterium]|nr:DNA polymerase III subunit beta [Planctomycetaceae bacterium]